MKQLSIQLVLLSIQCFTKIQYICEGNICRNPFFFLPYNNDQLIICNILYMLLQAAYTSHTQHREAYVFISACGFKTVSSLAQHFTV